MTDSKYFFDSSAWLSFFLSASQKVRTYLEDRNIILTSVLSLFEIKRKLLKEKVPLEKIEKTMAIIKSRSIVVELGSDVCDRAATLSVEHKLPALDSLIYTAALSNNAPLVTLDHDFENVDCVILLE